MNTAKTQLPDILPIWQPIGKSTYKITMDVAKIAGVKTAQTGVLDPLAEGVIIVLLREERLKKIDYAGWKKTYEFDIAFGIATDSYDGLGLVTNTQAAPLISKEKIENTLNTFVGKYEQHVPLYSAKKLNGKRMFEYPKTGTQPEYLPTKSGEIYSIELLNLQQTTLHTIINKVTANISLVKHGEFRQKETLENWSQYLTRHQDMPIQVTSIKAQMSRGLYVRSLSQDICSRLGVVGFVSKLVRTENGIYNINNCFSLEQVCGKLPEL